MGKTPNGFRKTGIHRARFILESVTELKSNLQKLGADLYIRLGKAEIELFELAKEIKSVCIFCNRERIGEEVIIQEELEQKLWTIGQELLYTRGKMLFYTSDLPFPITQTPSTFSSFRKEVEKSIEIRTPLPTISERIETIHNLDFGSVPTLSELKYDDSVVKQDNFFTGGENVGLNLLKRYIWDSGAIDDYKKKRRSLTEWHNSSRLSPWISIGALSPKLIHHEIRKYESNSTPNDGTHALSTEFLWRDYFRLLGKKHGDKIFQTEGFEQLKFVYKEDDLLLESWCNGQTGIPIIDANMRELKATGYISSRGRQLVSGFLIHELRLNWLLGAEYFESLLIDYDSCSNYCNWLYIAGSGNEGVEEKSSVSYSHFNRYDPEGNYTSKWVPEFR